MFAYSKNLENAVAIVCAFVSNNTTPAFELPRLIRTTFRSLNNFPANEAWAAPVAGPSHALQQTVFDDFIICLEDGKRFRSLKRHLWTSFGLSPDAYRRKWGLPATYPMSAPAFSRRRSAAAKSNQLGRHPRDGKARRHA